MKMFILVVITCGSLFAAPPSTDGTNAPGGTNFWKQARSGPHIHGYYEGRSPCQEIVRMLNAPDREHCIKIKWQLLLYQDPVTGVPTTWICVAQSAQNREMGDC